MRVCDRSGNQGSTTRRVLVTREAPSLQIVSVRNPVSPNGDGRVEDTQVTVRPAQAGSLSVACAPVGREGPVIRPLWTDVPDPAADVVVSWDGRRDDGERFRTGSTGSCSPWPMRAAGPPRGRRGPKSTRSRPRSRSPSPPVASG